MFGSTQTLNSDGTDATLEERMASVYTEGVASMYSIQSNEYSIKQLSKLIADLNKQNQITPVPDLKQKIKFLSQQMSDLGSIKRAHMRMVRRAAKMI